MSTAKATKSPNTFDPNQTFFLVKLPDKGDADSLMVAGVNGPSSGFEVMSDKGEKLEFSYAFPPDTESGAFIYSQKNVGTEITYTTSSGEVFSGASFGQFIVTANGLNHQGDLTGVVLGQGENTVLLNGAFNIKFAQ